MANMIPISTVVVGSGGAGSIDFTFIPQTYTDLVIKYSGRNDSNNGTLLVKYNNDGVTSNYLYRQVYGDGSAINNDTQADLFFGVVTRSTFTASTFSSGEIYIPNYTSSNYKSVTTDSVSENNSTSVITSMWAGIWKNTAPISRITLSLYTGAFVQHSTATLYGIRNARRSAGNSIKATGGNISFDGTYVVHTFNSSGTFTPTAALPDVDYLVVAGGGGGGYDAGGGGGAGGYREFTSASFTANTNYAVTVGAGGPGSTAGANKGSSGSTSTFNSNSSSGGGGGGSSASTGGASGGSGGGGRANGGTGGTGNSGSYSPSEGKAGATAGNPGAAGGGGGSGSVGGANSGTTTGGAGGSGTQWLDGTIYAAGGGGAANNTVGGANGGSTSGGGSGGSTSGSLGYGRGGQTNTGSGGGGGGENSIGGSGGSGVVIIRYKA